MLIKTADLAYAVLKDFTQVKGNTYDRSQACDDTVVHACKHALMYVHKCIQHVACM